MTITQEQYQLIVDVFPKPRGTVKVSNLQALNGILYVLEHGWAGLEVWAWNPKKRRLIRSFPIMHRIMHRIFEQGD